MKNKTIITLILIFSIFLTGMNIKADVSISNVAYPETVREGDPLRIVLSFTYDSAVYCLYGPNVLLTYSLTYESLPSLDKTYVTLKEPGTQIALGSPLTLSIEIDTSTLGLEEIDEDVLFTFQIFYEVGFIYYVGDVAQVSKVGFRVTEWHDLTITNDAFSTTGLIYIYSGSALAGLLLIGLSVYLIKKRRN